MFIGLEEGAAVTTSILELTISGATMANVNALPFAGEVGDNATFAYAMRFGGTTRLYGDFTALAAVIGANAAPTSRPSSGSSSFGAQGIWATATATIMAEEVTLSIDGAEVLGPLIQGAEDAASAAASSAAIATAAVPIPVSRVFPTPLTIGRCDGTGTSTTGGAQVFGIGPHHLRRALLKGFKVNSAGAGTFAIRRAIPTGDANRHKGSVETITFAVPTGVSTVDFAAVLSANGGKPFISEIGEHDVFAHTGQIKFTAGTREPFYSWPGGLEPNQPADTYLNLDADGATLDIEFYYSLADPVEPGEAVIERCTTFSAVPTTFTQFGAYGVDGAGAIVLSTGNLSHTLNTKRVTGLDWVTYRADFRFTSDASHLLFATNPAFPVDSGQMEGSMIAIERETGKLMVYNRWDGSTNVPPLDAADQRTLTNIDGSAFSPVVDHTYTLTVEKLVRDYRVSVVDPSGSSYFTTIVSDGGLNTYKPDGGTQTKHGLLHGAPVFASVTGTSKLLNWQVTAPYDVFLDWLVLGDSKTEGFGVLASERHPQLLADRLGQRRVAISGVGGSTTRGGITRLFCILEALRPRNVLINLGTNPESDATFAANLAVMIRIARNAGATVYVATVATSASISAAVIAAGARPVAFGSAVTQAGPGSTRLPTYYALTRTDGQTVSDGLHEGMLGHQREYAQLLRDTGIA